MSPQAVNLCAHARTNGKLCESPALKERRFCYYHQRDLDRRDALEQNLDHRRGLIAKGQTYELHQLLPDGKTIFDDNSVELFQEMKPPLLEDGDAIQAELSTLYRIIATRQVDHRTAALLLYNLKIATMNVRNTRPPFTRSNEHAMEDDSPIKGFGPMDAVYERARQKAQAMQNPASPAKKAASGTEG